MALLFRRYSVCSSVMAAFRIRGFVGILKENIRLLQRATLRAFSICQNWLAGPVVLIVKWAFSMRFSHKSTLTMYNIYILTDLTGQI